MWWPCVNPTEPVLLLDAVEETLAAARAAGTAVDPVTIRQREAHEDEWRDVWKQFFRATRVGRRFTVRPSWDAGEAPAGEFVIDLDPGMAFGTGAHPSTRLVIKLAEEVREKSPWSRPCARPWMWIRDPVHRGGAAVAAGVRPRSGQ